MTMDPLRSFDSFKRSLRDFLSWLPKSVPGAMDIDCLLERHGHILIVEGKPWDSRGGVYLTYGQYKALVALSSKEDTTVLLVGQDGDAWRFLNLAKARKPEFHKNGPHGQSAMWYAEAAFTATDRQQFGLLVEQWYQRINAQHEARKAA